jgi:uncharacterized membrane protein HdeD (DUF308 family)
MTGRNLAAPADSLGHAATMAGSLAFELAKKWWVVLLRGIMLIILGVLSFVSPSTWVIFVGAAMLLDGFAMLIAGLGDQPAGQSRWPLIIIGVLGLLAGLLVLWNPELAGMTLTYVIAVWAIVVGVLEIIAGVSLRHEIDNEWWLILTGILAIVFGVLVFRNVLAGVLTIAWVFGIFAIAIGIMSIALSFAVRSFGKRIGAVT